MYNTFSERLTTEGNEGVFLKKKLMRLKYSE